MGDFWNLCCAHHIPSSRRDWDEAKVGSSHSVGVVTHADWGRDVHVSIAFQLRMQVISPWKLLEYNPGRI